jgi:hypothetical protein
LPLAKATPLAGDEKKPTNFDAVPMSMGKSAITSWIYCNMVPLSEKMGRVPIFAMAFNTKMIL